MGNLDTDVERCERPRQRLARQSNFRKRAGKAEAVEKAEAELRRGAWLVSLEFEARELIPETVIYNKDNRPVWIYQVPFKRPEAAK